MKMVKERRMEGRFVRASFLDEISLGYVEALPGEGSLEDTFEALSVA